MKPLTTLLFILLTLSLQAQTPLPKYSRAQIDIEGHTMAELARLGLDVEHGEGDLEHSYTSDFSERELAQLRAAGFSYTILIDDVQRHYIEQNEQELSESVARDMDCLNGKEYAVPENFQLGTMGGYFTYEEMLANLASMAEKYPDLITTIAPTDTIKTHEGRSIYWVRISDNAQMDEDEPELLYDALIHAREPNSLAQMLFYMWYLLENYDSDPEIQYLVNNTEMYFIPCLNPDGYVYNQMTSPGGGGLWRKNKRDNDGDGSFAENIDGVDLNRNFSYQWGDVNGGSSGDFSSAVYRGPAPFSEPETSNLRNFCAKHDFKIALNYHTYGNLLIYPFSYNDGLADPKFREMAEVLTQENHYRFGTSVQTVGYEVNGDAADWMFGDTDTKPAIFGYIPEVGPSNFGFWPPSSAIIDLCRTAMLQNFMAAHLVLHYGVLQHNAPAILGTKEGTIPYDLKRYGLLDGSFTVSLEGLTDNVISIGADKTYMLPASGATSDEISYSLNPATEDGEAVNFLLSLDNGEYVWTDTLHLLFQKDETPVFTEPGDELNAWTATGSADWGTTSQFFYSAPSSITNAPNGFQSNTDNSLILKESISLIDAESATLRFWARWNIRPDRNYAQVSVSTTDGLIFVPLCGLYTVEGANGQNGATGEPVYEGSHSDWVAEEIDLSDYIGEEILLRFDFNARNQAAGELFFFDDLTVYAYEETIVSTQTLDASDFRLHQNQPNPADAYTEIQLEREVALSSGPARLRVYNALGFPVWEQGLVRGANQLIRLETANWPAGVYHYEVLGEDRRSEMRKLVVAH